MNDYDDFERFAFWGLSFFPTVGDGRRGPRGSLGALAG